MPWMWITRPEELGRVEGLEAEGERLRREIAAIEVLSNDAACRLCGAEATLTEEHAPSKRAGNAGRMIRGMIDYAASAAGGSVVWKGDIIQGAKHDSLCGPCNNNTGSWYNGAYVRLVRTCHNVAKVKASYNRKLWMKRKGDVPFWGCAGDQPQVPGATRGERYATYAGAYHWTDDSGDGGDGPGHIG